MGTEQGNDPKTVFFGAETPLMYESVQPTIAELPLRIFWKTIIASNVTSKRYGLTKNKHYDV